MRSLQNESLRKVSSYILVALLSPLIVLMHHNSEPASALIDKTLIRFSDGICDLSVAGYRGNGSSDSPYILSDSAALWESADCSRTGSPPVAAYFELSNDINVQDANDSPTTSPIGFTSSGSVGRSSFSGVLDGKNFGIYGVFITSAVSTVGLFWQLDAAVFRNLSLSGTVRYTGTTEGIGSGGISGRANSVTISNVTATVTISGSHITGGFVGTVSESMSVENSTMNGIIHGRVSSTNTRDGTGGFAGFVGGISFANGSNSFAEVSSSRVAGGFFGSALQGLSVSNSQNFGRVTAASAGGFAGAVTRGALTISNSINYGEISGSTTVAGFVGDHNRNNRGPSYINSSENKGTISASVSGDFVGGFIGSSDTGIVISNSTNSGSVSGRDKVAGFIGGDARSSPIAGYQFSLLNSSNLGRVSGRNLVGGLVGFGQATLLSGTMNHGQVMGTNYVGGLVGQSNIALTVSRAVNSANISGDGQFVGGFLGDAQRDIRILSSTNSGDISSSTSAGGFVGTGGSASSGQFGITVSASVNLGRIIASSEISGGFLGDVQRAYVSIFDSKNSGHISSGNGGKAGGFIGSLNGTGVAGPSSVVRRSENLGPVSTSGSFAGGLVGWNNWLSLEIEQARNSGQIQAVSEVGGLVGVIARQDLRISSSFNTGSVTGGLNIGGLIGLVEGQAADMGKLWITSSYNIGSVSGTSNIGGLAGAVHDASSIFHAYSAGLLSGTTNVDALIGSTSAVVTTTSVYVSNFSSFLQSSSANALRTRTNYLDWDFTSVWSFGECTQNSGYPVLRFSFIGETFAAGCYSPPSPQLTQSPTSSPSASLPAVPERPQPYSGPMIFAFLEPASAGAAVLLDGIRLLGINSVSLGDTAVSFSVVSSVSLRVMVPLELPAFEYDLIVLSAGGKLTVVRALKVSELVTTPPSPVLSDQAKQLIGKNQKLPNFTQGQQGISPRQERWLRDRFENSGLSSIVCTGVIHASMSMHTKILMRMRAQQTCLAAQRYLPSLSTRSQSKLSSSKSAAGSLLISFVR